MTRRSTARLLLLVPVAAVALALLAAAHDPPLWQAPIDYLIDAATGVVLVLAGLIAWDRRPSWRTGPLLVLAGYLWYVGSLYELVPDTSILPYLGFAFRGYYDLALAFVILAVPGDRLRRRSEAAVVVGLGATMVARTAWRLVATPPGVGSGYGPDAPASPLLLVNDIDQLIRVDSVLSALVGLALWLVAAAAVRRLLVRRPGATRMTDPVLIGGALWAALAGAYAIAGVVAQQTGVQLLPDGGEGRLLEWLPRVLGPLGLLLGMSRLRAGSDAAVAMLATGGAPPRGEELERALRRALGDPTLRVLYATEAGAWVDHAGVPTEMPVPGDGRAVTVIEAGGRTACAVVHDETLLDDPVVVRTVGAVVGLAVDNAQLQDTLRAQLDEVRASRTRIVEAADAERRRVERDLHDGAQQRLLALALSLRTIRSRLGEDVPDSVAVELDAAADEIRAANAELRELAQGLDPAILREAGLGAAVQSLADRSPVPVQVDLALDGRLPAGVETAAYFVAAEALANVAKHARATAVRIRGTVAGSTAAARGRRRRGGRRRRQRGGPAGPRRPGRCRRRHLRTVGTTRWRHEHRGDDPVRVVIGEDSVLLRAGLERLLVDGGFEVVGTAGELDGLISLVEAVRPDVAVLDIRMPPTFTDEGLRAARHIRALPPPTPGCLVLSQHIDPRFGLELVTQASGGLGYLLKERVSDVEDFLDAVRRVGRGGSIVDPEVVREIVARRRRDVLVELTDREREVLELMAQGRSNAAICRALSIGPKTLEARISTIFSKLGLEPAEDDNRRVLAVLSLLRGPATPTSGTG